MTLPVTRVTAVGDACRTQDKSLCYRIRWPIIVFGFYLGAADVIFQTLATYHSQFKSAWNPVLEYKVSPKVSGHPRRVCRFPSG